MRVTTVSSFYLSTSRGDDVDLEGIDLRPVKTVVVAKQSGMNKKRNGYEPTESEAEMIERAGLNAAWHEMQVLKDDDLNISLKTLACLKGFKAARIAMRDARNSLNKLHPDYDYVSHFTSETNIVCTALCALDDDPKDFHPRSVLGGRISVLFQAAKALEAMSIVYSAFDDDDDIFGTYLAEETTMLAEAYINKP
jgi:hypothetical protein